MTKEQAYKNLSLAEDVDSERIRIRFAARYSLSDEAYDRTLTEGMKAVHEQHLRELETAYKVLMDSPVINDMGALLSLSKGYITEGEDTIGDEPLSPEEALAFFALYPHDKPLRAEERYLQYKRELEESINQTGLESSKEPFRQEMIRADACLQVAVNYLMANEILQSESFLEEAVEKTKEAGDEGDKLAEKPVDVTEPEVSVTPAVKTAKTKWLLPLAAITLITLGGVVGLWEGNRDELVPLQHSETDTVNEDASEHRRDKNRATEETVSHPGGPATVQPDTLVEMQSGEPVDSIDNALKREVGVLAAELRPLGKLLEGVSDYRLSEQSTYNTWYLAPNDSTKRSFVVPVSSVATVNVAGTLEAKEGRTFQGFFANGRPTNAAIVPGFLKRTVSPTQREALMKELDRLGVQLDIDKPTAARSMEKAKESTKQEVAVKQDTTLNQAVTVK